MNNQRIVPHLWFDNEAQEAVDYYMQTFPESEIISDVTFTDTPSGDAKQLTFNIFGYKFMAINAGPYFTKILPYHLQFFSINLKQHCSTKFGLHLHTTGKL